MILWALINRNSESNNKEIFYLTKQSPGYKAGSPHYISPVPHLCSSLGSVFLQVCA